MSELAVATARAVAPRRTAQGSAIASVGASLPANVVGNGPIAARLGVTEEWIVKRTGISSRRIAAPDDRLADLAAHAGQTALERAGFGPADVDLVLVATTTADDVLPNSAPLVADALGAAQAGAIDVGAACTGFLSAVALGTAQIEAGRADVVLIVGADLMSRITDPTCRQTAALFGDGAGAAVLTAVDGEGRVGPVVLGADGGAGASLIVVDRDESLIKMQGHETFKHAVARMSQATAEALARSELDVDDVDLFVYHQANGRILRAVAEQLDLPQERVIDCIDTHGNTSAATLPLALAHAEATHRLRPGDRVLLGAFGAGFTWGACVVAWGAPAA
jgi:3-oxoacyl-[acyl-carrier-protein] synthase-3